MSDIVERLRKRANMVTPWATCCGEAAAEIERLRAAINGIVEKGVDDLTMVAAFQVNEELRADIERLRAAIRDAHGLIDNDLVVPWIIAHKLDDVLGIHKP